MDMQKLSQLKALLDQLDIDKQYQLKIDTTENAINQRPEDKVFMKFMVGDHEYGINNIEFNSVQGLEILSIISKLNKETMSGHMKAIEELLKEE